MVLLSTTKRYGYASYQHVFADKAQAEAMLNELTAKANATASEPCQIKHQFADVEGGVQLTADFTFLLVKQKI